MCSYLSPTHPTPCSRKVIQDRERERACARVCSSNSGNTTPPSFAGRGESNVHFQGSTARHLDDGNCAGSPLFVVYIAFSTTAHYPPHSVGASTRTTANGVESLHLEVSEQLVVRVEVLRLQAIKKKSVFRLHIRLNLTQFLQGGKLTSILLKPLK